MKRKKFLSLLTAAVLAVTLTAGCGVYQNSSSEPAPAAASPESSSASSSASSDGTQPVSVDASGKTLRYSITDEPPTLDPQMVNSMYGATLDFHLFEGVVRNNCGTIEPGMAESWEISEDGLTYTFHLREGNKWSDGEPVKAQDFVYGLQRAVDPKTAAPSAFMVTVVKNAGKIMNGELAVTELGVSAPDDYTVEYTLEHPAGYFLGILSTSCYYPTRQDLVESYGKDFAADADKNVYNGPFTLESWAHASKLIFTKNDNYWDSKAVNLDTVDISIITDKNTAFAMYEQGLLDYVAVPSEMVSQYPDAKSQYTGAVSYIEFNVQADELTGNKNFRKALSAALDRTEYSKLAHSGTSEPTARFVLPIVSGAEGNYGDEYPLEAFSLTSEDEKAKEYLAAAMKELGIADPSDITLTLNVTDAESSRKEGEVIQNQWQTKLGIQVEINQVPYKQFYEEMSAKDYTVAMTGWVPDYSDPYSYLELMYSGATDNNAMYTNPDYNATIDEAQNNTDPKGRMASLFEAEKIVCDDLPIIPTTLTKEYYLVNDKLVNFQTYFVGTGLNYIYTDITE